MLGLARTYWVRLGVVLAGLLLWRCGSEGGREATGTMSMNLSTQVGGATYRLRDAFFDVTGPETLVLSGGGAGGDVDDGVTTNDGSSGCDESVGAGCGATLTQPLIVGSYTIFLGDGWRLQRSDGAGFVDVGATLVSPNPVGFSIASAETTRVAFAFEAEGRVIDFARGVLELSIEVTEVGLAPVFDAASCDFADLTGCEALTCEAACPTTDGGSCLTRCSNVIDCVSTTFEDGFCVPTEDDLMCGVRFQAQADFCTSVVEPAGGNNPPTPAPGQTPQPAFVARELVRCLCSTPRP